MSRKRGRSLTEVKMSRMCQRSELEQEKKMYLETSLNRKWGSDMTEWTPPRVKVKT